MFNNVFSHEKTLFKLNISKTKHMFFLRNPIFELQQEVS